MKKIFYPGNDLQPCEAEYSIVRRRNGDGHDYGFRHAHIVIVQELSPGKFPGTSLMNTSDKILSDILNRIMESELKGIRAEFIEFDIITLAMPSHGEMEASAYRFPIELDLNDYIAGGNRHREVYDESNGLGAMLKRIFVIDEPKIAFNSVDVVAGCARFFVEFAKRERIPEQEAKSLLEDCGFNLSGSNSPPLGGEVRLQDGGAGERR